MFISKKKYNELVEQIDNLNEKLMKQIENSYKQNGRISELESKMAVLGDIHNLTKSESYFNWARAEYTASHDTITINTENVKDVTLKELAKFVLDDKPIKRTKTVDVEYTK